MLLLWLPESPPSLLFLCMRKLPLSALDVCGENNSAVHSCSDFPRSAGAMYNIFYVFQLCCSLRKRAIKKFFVCYEEVFSKKAIKKS